MMEVVNTTAASRVIYVGEHHDPALQSSIQNYINNIVVYGLQLHLDLTSDKLIESIICREGIRIESVANGINWTWPVL